MITYLREAIDDQPSVDVCTVDGLIYLTLEGEDAETVILDPLEAPALVNGLVRAVAQAGIS